MKGNVFLFRSTCSCIDPSGRFLCCMGTTFLLPRSYSRRELVCEAPVGWDEVGSTWVGKENRYSHRNRESYSWMNWGGVLLMA